MALKASALNDQWMLVMLLLWEITAVAVRLAVLSSSFIRVVAVAYAASLGSFESLCKLWVVGLFVFVLWSSDGVPSSGASMLAW